MYHVFLLRPDDTLHLEVSLPTVRPKLVLDRGSNIVDFGPVCKGNMLYYQSTRHSCFRLLYNLFFIC